MKEREKRVVLGGILAALLIAGTSVMMDREGGMVSGAGEIERKRMLLRKYNSLIDRKESLAEDLKRAREGQKVLEKSLLKSEAPSLAAAHLQKFLHEEARRLNITIKSEKVNKPVVGELFTAISVEVVIRSNLKNLMDFIYRLEKSDRFFSIDKLKMKVLKKVSKREEEILETKLETIGYFLNPSEEDSGEFSEEKGKVSA